MLHSTHPALPAGAPGAGFPASLLFQDVDPDVLAREAASDVPSAAVPGADAWQAYLRRALPAMEHRSARDMAAAMLDAGHGPLSARGHAASMRRRALAAGDVTRMRFWNDVLAALPIS